MKEEIGPEEVLEEVQVTVDKDAFKGPFTCCNETTKKELKKVKMKEFEFKYEAWHCNHCGTDHLDVDQAKRLETFWAIERLLDDKLLTLERTINFDGKTHFLRFPKEISKNWRKGKHAEIKLLTPEKFLVEIKA